jgi:hypothetical protein
MERYTISGLPAATAATIDHCIAELWSPTTRIAVKKVVIVTTTGVLTMPRIARTTAKGTAGSTLTPTIVNEHDRNIAPPTAVTMELSAFSVQPTLEALRLDSAHLPAAIGAGWIWDWSDDPIWIPAANGLAITEGIASASAATVVTFSFLHP